MSPFYYVLIVNGVLFFFAVIFYLFPPKKINMIYGYRTNRSMQNQNIWDFANKTFTVNLLLYSAISFGAGIVLAFINPENTITWIPMALLILTLLVCVIKTEQELNKHFDDEGNKK